MKLVKKDGFHIINVLVNDDTDCTLSKAVFEARPDINAPCTYRKQIDFTDLQKSLKLYFIEGRLMLPSEY